MNSNNFVLRQNFFCPSIYIRKISITAFSIFFDIGFSITETEEQKLAFFTLLVLLSHYGLTRHIVNLPKNKLEFRASFDEL
jgi:hypothetical protein